MKPFNRNPIAGTLQYTVGNETYGVTLKTGNYGNGRPALTLESQMGRVAVATVNLPDVELPSKDHLHIKTWSENESMLAFLVANGIVEDTGIDVDTASIDVATGSPYVMARLVKKGPNYPERKPHLVEVQHGNQTHNQS